MMYDQFGGWILGGSLGSLPGLLNNSFNQPAAIAQAQLFENYKAAIAQAQLFENYKIAAKMEREKFYRSCSQNWLNAMLDVELGVYRP